MAARPGRAIDRRLRREIPALRRHRAVDLALALTTGVAAVGQAVALATALAAIATGDPSIPVATVLVAFVGAVTVRAGLSWARGTLARRTAATVTSDLRARLLDHTAGGGPVELAGRRHGELATTLTTGLDTLAPYFTGYRPAVVGAAVIPAVVVAGLAVVDPLSAVVVALTLPLVPIFGALVGAHTRDRTARQWGLLARLGGHFLDAVTGLPTLRAFGRAGHQVAVVEQMAQRQRHATMRTLRVAFLSALVLELVATLSVALVAVPMGLRLLEGSVGLGTALIVLFLAPEAYLPLRAMGTAFHDSAGGIAVAEKVFEQLDAEPPAPGGCRTPPTGTAPALDLESVTARYPGNDSVALDGTSLRIDAGERVGLVGPSGAGKSTLLAVLLGFLPAESGRLLVDGVDLNRLDLACWRDHIAWVPQRPHLFAATVADNIRLGRPGASSREVRTAAEAAFADEFVTALPHGYDTVLGERGAGLSTGQRQRIALARAFLRDAPLLLLDEPTAGLDPQSEDAVVRASARLMAGRTAVVVAHRPALLEHVTRVVAIEAPCPGLRPARHEPGRRLDGETAATSPRPEPAGRPR